MRWPLTWQRETRAFIEKLGDTEVVSIGSALKLCLVAEGAVDVYLGLVRRQSGTLARPNV